jgi:predicted ATPase
MLTRVQIKNFRCLRDVDVPLKPLTVLIGPNNTGKSSFLAGIHQLATVHSKLNEQLEVLPTDFCIFGNRAQIRIEGTTSREGEVAISSEAMGPWVQWTTQGRTSELTPVNYYRIAELMVSMESEGLQEGIGLPQIDDYARNLAGYLDALLRKSRSRFFRITDELQKLVAGLEDLNISTPSPSLRRIDLVIDGGNIIEGRLGSHGVKLIIFFLALANHPSPAKLILLEEPETGVHPKRLADIMRLLRGLSEGLYTEQPTQVVLSTHSPYLLDYVNPGKDQVLVFERLEDGSRNARPVDNNRLKLFLDEFMLGEVWYSQDEAGLVEKTS